MSAMRKVETLGKRKKSIDGTEGDASVGEGRISVLNGRGLFV
jgi:hypothetical protein